MFWNKSTAGANEAPSASAPPKAPSYSVTQPVLGNAGTPVKFNSVDFRDGQQSLLATRVTTADMIPVLTAMDKIGYDSMEMWGGATFDVMVRFLKIDPWNRIYTFKKFVKNTPLKMVCRGQNLVGYHAYPDDIVERFIAAAANAGIDVFLIFDALDDLRNCETAFNAVKKAGKKIEGSVQYNISKYHTIEHFVSNAKEQERMGASLIHVEDMAGLMTPAASYELISALKKELNVPVHLHCHCTGGLAVASYWEAIRAGVDGLDVCTSSLSMGPSLPAIETFAAALRGTSRDPKIDIGKFKSINRTFANYRKDLAEFESKLIGVDVGCLQHQIPGGMLSNLESQLTQMGCYDRLQDVLDEAIRVREDMGFPPLATPSSQMCGSQATMNVLTGKRYGVVSKEMKDYCRGMYGKAPGPISPELMKAAIGDEEPLTGRPADYLEPGYEKAKKDSEGYARTEEDILTWALFPENAKEFFIHKYQLKEDRN